MADKIEIPRTKPENFHETWPGQYSIFSHFEYSAGVPQPLFLISTIKENGNPNLNFHSWSAFSGDSGGYFAILTGLGQHTHTYANLLREKEFCIGFINAGMYQGAIATIHANDSETDEFSAGGFTPEQAKLVKPPRIAEAILSYECLVEDIRDLSGKGISAMVIGRVVHAAVAKQCTALDGVCGDAGFIMNIHSPRHPLTGHGLTSGFARLEPVWTEEE